MCSRWYVRWAAVLGIGCLAVGCNAPVAEPAAATDGRHDEPVSVSVSVVKRQPVQRRVLAVGTLWGFERITLTPKVEGRVRAVKFEVGDRVAPGEVVLEIDDTDYVLASSEAGRALEMELAKLALDRPPEADFDVDNLPTVVRAKLQLDNAHKRFDRQRMLQKKAAGNQELLEQAEMEYQVAQASLRQAHLEVRTNLAAVRHKQAVLAQAEQNLRETRVLAPHFAGHPLGENSAVEYVVAERMVSAGEMVRAFPSTAVYELVFDGVLKLAASIPERYSSELRVGQPVEVHVEAFPGKVFAAVVSRLNPTVDPRNRTFEIEAHVPNPDRQLKSGGFAKADVLTRVDDQALTVPREAIVSLAGVNKVFLIRDSKAVELPVDVDTQGDGWVEVHGPLADGETIVTSGHSQLTNGAPVSVRPRVAAESVTRK